MNYQNASIKTFYSNFIKKLNQTMTYEELEHVRVTFLGRNGFITQLMSQIKTLSIEEKRLFGPEMNRLKKEVQELFDAKKHEIEKQSYAHNQAKKELFDVSCYQPGTQRGSLHPYTHVIQEIEDVFISMGFTIADGPEIETEFINFEALNIPEDHPARDMHDTFWLDIPGMLLRTHTSTVQSRAMSKNKLPLAIAAPGRCYRHEATDASHDFMFMQCEGLVIDKNISMAHLLATMKSFLKGLFKKDNLQIRLRPSYFPFVEPGVEIDMTCPFCKNGCSVCKKSTWIEICGAGLVHPNVLKAGGIDPSEYRGFAFGFGLTRLTMLKYGINDIRLLHGGKVNFLKQF